MRNSYTYAKGIRRGLNCWVEGEIITKGSEEDMKWFIKTEKSEHEIQTTSLCTYTGVDYNDIPIYNKDLIAIYDAVSKEMVSLMEVYRAKVTNMYFLRPISGDIDYINKKLGFHLIPDLELSSFFKWIKEENKGGEDKEIIRVLGSVINPNMYLGI